MDERLQRLERAFRQAPGDEQVARELARAYLRAGRPARALTAARPHGEGEERVQAGEALAGQLGLSFAGIRSGCERFHQEEYGELILIPGGAFLEEGAEAFTSTLELGGERAALKRVVLPDYLMGDAVLAFSTHDEARAEAHRQRGRLPTIEEWKKSWRGGLFLDGDETAATPNEEPDRVLPWGVGEPEPLTDQTPPALLCISVYGVTFWLGARCEWTESSARYGLVLRESGRYRTPLERPAQRRVMQLVGRLVRELPPNL